MLAGRLELPASSMSRKRSTTETKRARAWVPRVQAESFAPEGLRRPKGRTRRVTCASECAVAYRAPHRDWRASPDSNRHSSASEADVLSIAPGARDGGRSNALRVRPDGSGGTIRTCDPGFRAQRLTSLAIPERCARSSWPAGEFGWRRRTRTFSFLIQSQVPYHLATRQ